MDEKVKMYNLPQKMSKLRPTHQNCVYFSNYLEFITKTNLPAFHILKKICQCYLWGVKKVVAGSKIFCWALGYSLVTLWAFWLTLGVIFKVLWCHTGWSAITLDNCYLIYSWLWAVDIWSCLFDKIYPKMLAKIKRALDSFKNILQEIIPFLPRLLFLSPCCTPKVTLLT